MGKLRIGVMGCADIAWRAMIPAMIECEDIYLVVVASRSKEKSRKFAYQFNCESVVGYERLLDRNDIDAVYMPLPTGLHNEWIIKTLESDKHILVEKSFAENYESAEHMVNLAQSKNLLVLENFLFPHHSQHRWVKDLIKQGELGEIKLFRSTFGFPPLSEYNFRYNRNIGGGALLDAGAYVVKACTLFLGNNLILLGSALQYDKELGVDIYGDAMFKNLKGQVGQVSFGFNYYYQCHYELLGSKGKLTVERAFTPPPGFRPIVCIEHQNRKQIFTLPEDNHYINMLKFFANLIRNGQDFSTSWNDLLIQAKFIDTIRKASV